MIMDKPKWKTPLPSKVPPKENKWRDREEWNNKGGAKRSEGREAKASRTDFGFSHWGE